MMNVLFVKGPKRQRKDQRNYHFEFTVIYPDDTCKPALGKFNRYQNIGDPFTVPNEYICSSIAKELGITTPTFHVTHLEGRYYFVSELITGSYDLPAINPKEAVSQNPYAATGIILLDILIANADRKEADLWFDPKTKQIYAFDYSHALLGYRRPPGFNGVHESGTHQRLNSMTEKLGILKEDDPCCTGHCLVPFLKTGAYISHWAERIAKLSDSFIQEIVETGFSYDDGESHKLSLREQQFCIQFLCKRKSQIISLIAKHRDKFPGISQWDFLNS